MNILPQINTRFSRNLRQLALDARKLLFLRLRLLWDACTIRYVLLVCYGRVLLRTASFYSLGHCHPGCRYNQCTIRFYPEDWTSRMRSFEELGLPACALDAVNRLGFETPTPVQEAAIPLVLEGKDVIAAASTGTGKTAAFLLPTLGKMPKRPRKQTAPRALVITPTRELAEQIAYNSSRIARCCGLYSTAVFGGKPYSPQIKELRRGTDILIATPGRLNDLIDRGVADLSKVEVLVLDEADRMLDMGFLPAVKSIVSKVPDQRQTLLFSATIDESIQKNLATLLTDPEIVQIAKKGETAKIVEQSILPVSNTQKPELLKCLLDEKGHERVIVFARTRHRAEDLAKELKRSGYDVVCIHSDKTQGQRKQALQAFRKGQASVIVATDVLARGIDIPEVDYVVNYDLPDMAEDYIHRIGRTGRAGNAGFAVSFVAQKQLDRLTAIESLIGRNLPVMRIGSFDVDMSQLAKPSRRERAKAREGVSKKNAKSAARAKRYRDKKKQSKREYDYIGYGDLRKGAKKRKDQRPEDAPEKPHKDGRRSKQNAQKGPSKKQGAKGSAAKRRDDKRPGRSQRKKRR